MQSSLRQWICAVASECPIVISVDDLELLEALENRVDLAAAKKALKEPGRRSWQKVKADLGL